MTHHICRTWLDPGRVKFVQEVFTGLSRGYASAHDHLSRRRFTCTCRRYKKSECVVRLFIRTMSELVKRHILCIQALNRYKSTKLRRAIIANADLLCALAECAYNIFKKNIPLTELQRRRLRKSRTKLRELSQRRAPAARRRRILLQQQAGEGQSGGFLSGFLAPLACSIFLHLLREVLLKR